MLLVQVPVARLIQTVLAGILTEDIEAQLVGHLDVVVSLLCD